MWNTYTCTRTIIVVVSYVPENLMLLVLLALQFSLEYRVVCSLRKIAQANTFIHSRGGGEEEEQTDMSNSLAYHLAKLEACCI